MESTHVFVRPATALDAPAFGQIQSAAMVRELSAASTRMLPESVLDHISRDDFTRRWRDTLSAPFPAGSTVLTAVADGVVVGLCAGFPYSYYEGDESNESLRHSMEITAFEVREECVRRGHGSRMLAALGDHAHTVRADEIGVWIFAGDEARTDFFSSAGFAPSGARRSFTLDEESVTEHRWHALLA